ncbi:MULTISPECIES: pirin family protein [unclassified Burkholderia]|uniref:pirin family protein n=1 Tax=unclassified Burkholderia TaxID=2613784 RepID=UPI000F58072D|nr:MULTISPECIES: pirin family protein [unclassified Burkholderia]RQR30146.1 pirin family protein [Burkholderia sp. Bp9142]RQR50028.1 pirin family protein [Burkholderia sp. Bp9140]
MTTSNHQPIPRRIVHRTRGQGHGPITRLMSPSDLGGVVKPFVFLDLFDAGRTTIQAMASMPLHPHSGVATVTILTEGSMRYHDPASGSGTIGYGGVEWMRAGRGVWHGKEMSPDDVPRVQGFQLWLALPAELESSEPVSRYIEAADMVRSGPASIIVGNYEDKQSPVPAPADINYLLVTLPAGTRWTYQPPAGHTVGWLAVAKGRLNAGTVIDTGEMVIFESGEASIALEASNDEDAVFVLGSAVPHGYPLHLGYYSVHTSAQALEAGERRIAELGRKLREAGDRRTDSGTIPVFR